MRTARSLPYGWGDLFGQWLPPPRPEIPPPDRDRDPTVDRQTPIIIKSLIKPRLCCWTRLPFITGNMCKVLSFLPARPPPSNALVEFCLCICFLKFQSHIPQEEWFLGRRPCKKFNTDLFNSYKKCSILDLGDFFFFYRKSCWWLYVKWKLQVHSTTIWYRIGLCIGKMLNTIQLRLQRMPKRKNICGN